MDDVKLFTDGSADPNSNIGYGAYLIVAQAGLSLDTLRCRVKLRRFEHTSSTKLEMQTLLWALSDAKAQGRRVRVYTDSQNIIGLLRRRDRLEKKGYLSNKQNLICHHALYREFYRRVDLVDCEFIKVAGHKTSHQQDETDRCFSLVDRASRKALRKEISRTPLHR
jgi:ribonuclease HI